MFNTYVWIDYLKICHFSCARPWARSCGAQEQVNAPGGIQIQLDIRDIKRNNGFSQHPIKEKSSGEASKAYFTFCRSFQYHFSACITRVIAFHRGRKEASPENKSTFRGKVRK